MICVAALWFTGCANQFTNVLAETDSAIKEARSRVSGKLCKKKFDEIRGMRSKAQDLFFACETEKAKKLAKAATEKAKNLCLPKPAPKVVKAAPVIKPVNDSDGDGLLDNVDQCPYKPEDKDQFEDTDGCPDPDNDKDGILDVNDKCINTPENKNGYQDEDGCPDVLPKRFILEGVNFETNSAKLDAPSVEILDEAAKILTDNPKLRVRIEGHTDSRASAKYNQDLSDRRAQAVKDYFISRHGVSPGRLTSKGYGEDVPITSNDTAEGRAKNRRVELVPIHDLSQ